MVGVREIIGLAGWIYGAMMGWIMGGLLGAVVGAVAAAILATAPFEIYDAWTRRRKRARLRPFFGEYHASDKKDAWEETRARLKPGEVVKGAVVHKGRSFAFVDIAYGFPAILYRVDGPSDRKKSAVDSLEASSTRLPALGSEIEGQIMGYNELEREIEITRSGRWLLLDGDIVGFLAYDEWPLDSRYYLRPTQCEAYAAFLKLPKSELASRCEVLTADETQKVSVRRESRSYVTISLLEDASSPP